MARGGVYKAEVLRAREKLLALGRYPSIDAVRAELGDTGSKTTIHRYLKEIDEEEGAGTGTKVAVSEAIQDLVGRLAGRLHEEADGWIAEAATKHRADAERQTEALAALTKEAEGFRLELERSQLALAEERGRHAETTARLQAESLERAQFAQQVVDFKERLAAEQEHRQSLEEKHQHARDALEHFRQSVKEQREQEQRQHEQQVQYLQGEARMLNQTLAEKQHEAIHLNQENARLAGEVGRAEAELHKAQGELRALKDVKERLAASDREAEDLRRQVVRKDAQIAELIAGREAAAADVKARADRVQELEIELAAAKAARTAQDELAASISGYLSSIAGKSTGKAAKPGAKEGQETLSRP